MASRIPSDNLAKTWSSPIDVKKKTSSNLKKSRSLNGDQLQAKKVEKVLQGLPLIYKISGDVFHEHIVPKLDTRSVQNFRETTKLPVLFSRALLSRLFIEGHTKFTRKNFLSYIQESIPYLKYAKYLPIPFVLTNHELLFFIEKCPSLCSKVNTKILFNLVKMFLEKKPLRLANPTLFLELFVEFFARHDRVLYPSFPNIEQYFELTDAPSDPTNYFPRFNPERELYLISADFTPPMDKKTNLKKTSVKTNSGQTNLSLQRIQKIFRVCSELTALDIMTLDNVNELLPLLPSSLTSLAMQVDNTSLLFNDPSKRFEDTSDISVFPASLKNLRVRLTSQQTKINLLSLNTQKLPKELEGLSIYASNRGDQLSIPLNYFANLTTIKSVMISSQIIIPSLFRFPSTLTSLVLIQAKFEGDTLSLETFPPSLRNLTIRDTFFSEIDKGAVRELVNLTRLHLSFTETPKKLDLTSLNLFSLQISGTLNTFQDLNNFIYPPSLKTLDINAITLSNASNDDLQPLITLPTLLQTLILSYNHTTKKNLLKLGEFQKQQVFSSNPSILILRAKDFLMSSNFQTLLTQNWGLSLSDFIINTPF